MKNKFNKYFNTLDEKAVKEIHDDMQYYVRKLDLSFEGKEFPFVIKPYVIKKKAVDNIKFVTEKLLDIIERITDNYFTDKYIYNFFSYYNKYDTFINTKPKSFKRYITISRFDTIPIGEKFKVLETNTCCPGGIINNALLKSNYINNKYIKNYILNDDINLINFDHDDPINFINKITLNKKRNLAITNYNNEYTNELKELLQCAKSHGIDAVQCDIKSLKLRGDKLLYNDMEIDVIYNKINPLTIQPEEITDVIMAIKKGIVESINSFAAMFISESKMILSLLFDKYFRDTYMSEEEIDIVNNYVAWTAILKDDQVKYEEQNVNLLQHIMQEKDNFVIKVDNMTRGENVFIGKDLENSEWEQLIRKNTDKNWVVQQYYEMNNIEIPVVNKDGKLEYISGRNGLDFYMLEGLFYGVQARFSKSRIINIGHEGYVQPVIQFN